ncbi:hypothetical protein [Streptomyces sp. NPDC060243]|uniref:hypothetical protein n=1 Tax=Streptomyces sp. NPDC060243 TaxID=3347081 RepID=UPI00366009A1
MTAQTPLTGDALVSLDTKGWRRTWETHLHAGRVHCGPEDRHEQAEKAAQHARTVADTLGLPAGMVVSMLAIHGSPIAGGRLLAHTPYGPVHVLGAPMLLPVLRAAASGRDDVAAVRLARLVENRLRPYPRAS